MAKRSSFRKSKQLNELNCTETARGPRLNIVLHKRRHCSVETKCVTFMSQLSRRSVTHVSCDNQININEIEVDSFKQLKHRKACIV